VRISDLSIASNQFEDSGSIVTFRLQNLYLDDLNLRANRGDSILLFQYLNDKAIVHLESPSVRSNKVFKGSALKMEEASDFLRTGYSDFGTSGSGFYHLKVFGGTFSSNYVDTVSTATDHGSKTSCIDFSGTYEDSWAAIYIGGSTKLDSNQGVITNEIYVDGSVALLEIHKVTWTSSIEETSETKMAQVIYKPPSHSFELRVKSSTFTCTDVTYDEDVIMRNDISSVQGRASLFRLGQVENIEVLPLL